MTSWFINIGLSWEVDVFGSFSVRKHRVPFVTSIFNFHHQGGGAFDVHHMKHRFCGDCSSKFTLRLATVLLGRDNYDIEWAPTAVKTFAQHALYGSGSWKLKRMSACPENRALTISFNSATSEILREVESGSVSLLATMALLRELRTLDLLSMMLEQSAGLLSKKLPPAAEFKES
ncbi:hypothetical protein Tco_0214428 [Tanacetum coccineum]